MAGGARACRFGGALLSYGDAGASGQECLNAKDRQGQTAPQQNNLFIIALICQANHVNSNFVTIRRATPPQ